MGLIFRMLRRLACLLALLALPALAQGDIVELKDGTKISGEVLSKGSRLVRIRDDRGKIVTVRTGDVKRIVEGEDLDTADADSGRDAPFMPGFSDEQRKKVREHLGTWEGPLGVKLNAAARKRVWVAGDLSPAELSRIAEAVRKTYDDFCSVMSCEEAEVLEESDAAELVLVVFRQEPKYLRFTDRVFDRMRDETVSDERFKLMRRQPSYWVLTPRPLSVRFQGPATLEILIGNASHQSSHAMLLLWEDAGGWMPWWLLEGFATWQEIRLTGTNMTYCLEVARPGDYAREGTPEADEAAKAALEKAWRRAVKGRVKSRDERGLGVLGNLSLNQLEHHEVQESWSVVDWLHRTGKLKAFVLAYKKGRTLSAATEDALKMSPDAAHEAWRKYVLKTY